MPTANARASCARPCGLIRPASTAADGDPGKAARSCAQKRTAEAQRSESLLCSCFSWFLFLLLLLLLLLRAGACRFYRAPYGAAGSGRKGPQGRREGSRRFRRQRRDALSTEPGHCLRTCRAGARQAHRSGCPFSWLLLFGQAKRSDSPAWMRAKHAGRESVSRQSTKSEELTPSPPNPSLEGGYNTIETRVGFKKTRHPSPQLGKTGK